MRLSILIPTYNRSIALNKNLLLLDEYITKLNLQSSVDVIVSDNDSSDNDHIKNECSVPEFKNSITYIYQTKNIGYEKNILFLLNKCESDYVMYLGDDDYLSFDLFSLILDYVKSDLYTCIVCNYYLVDEFGKRISDALRDPIDTDMKHIKNDYIFALKAHQLSCLTFKTKGVYDFYISSCKANLYPTISFIGYCMSCGDGIHITRYPYANTQIKKKNFDYSFDNLLEDACISFENIPFNDEEVRTKAYYYFLHEDRDRFVNKATFFHPLRFVRKVKYKYNVGDQLKKQIVFVFICEWFKLPFRYVFRKHI